MLTLDRLAHALRGYRARGVKLALGALCVPCATLPSQNTAHLGERTVAPLLADSLGLADLYRALRLESPRAAAARALTRAVEARIPGAKRPPDPQLQLGFMNYLVPSLRPMDPLGMTQLTAMQMLPLPGKLRLAGRIATEQSAAQSARATDVEWEVRNQGAMAFYDLHQTEQALVVARETLRLLRDLQETTESMYRVGEGRQADVLRAQVEVARMSEDTIRMQAMRLAMASRLNGLLNRAAEAAVASPAVPPFPDTVPALNELVAAAERERPMVRAGDREVDAAATRTALARRELWPDLTLGIQYGQRAGEMNTERMWSLMLGATVPIFARSRQLLMREEAHAMLAMSQADVMAMRAATRADVAQAHANLARARSLGALYRTTILPQAQAAVAASLAAYRASSIPFMAALDSRMTLNRYRQELFTLIAEEGKAWAELEMLLGRELFNASENPRDPSRNGGLQ